MIRARIHRVGLIALAALALVTACGPDEATQPAAARAQMREDPRLAAAWPLLLQHCLRTPLCDPMAQIGDGAGEASGAVGDVVWRAHGADGAGEVTISLLAIRGRGGAAGRPLSSTETPANLRARRDRAAWLSLAYQIATEEAEEVAATMLLRSPHLVLAVPGGAQATSRRALEDITRTHVQSLTWSDGEVGARIAVIGASGPVVTTTTVGAAAASTMTDADALRLGAEPWLFETGPLSPPAALLDALRAGDTLSLRITVPDGGVILTDAFYSGGYAVALQQATTALTDPEIAQPIAERCARFASEPDSFWMVANVSPALLVCDPRTPEQRAADESATPR